MPASHGNVAKLSPLRALIRVAGLVLPPKISLAVPIKDVVGDRARRLASGSPFLLLILFQWRCMSELDIAVEEIAVKKPWSTRTTIRVVPKSAWSDSVCAHEVVRVTTTMATKSTEEAATMTVC